MFARLKQIFGGPRSFECDRDLAAPNGHAALCCLDYQFWDNLVAGRSTLPLIHAIDAKPATLKKNGPARSSH